jgi:sulfatase modifying factor 1
MFFNNSLKLGKYLLILGVFFILSCGSDNSSDPVVPDPVKTPVINTLNVKTFTIGTKITLIGKNFGASRGTSVVSMNGVSCITYDIWNDSTINCTVPSGVTTGKLKVIVSDKSSNEIDYTIQQSYSLVPLVLIPKGSFMMGATSGSDWDNKPQHKVNITGDFWMSKTEITQEIWKVVYGSISNPSQYVGDKLPVDQVVWLKAIDFCNQLSKIEKLTPCYTVNGDQVTCNWSANGYRLPTEAEWEYACRAGTTNDFYGNILDIGWTNENAGNKPQNAGQKTPNAFGLYDMSGNVYEWCWDIYDSDYYGVSPSDDPKGPTSGSERVLRGGSWIDGTDKAKSSARYSTMPNLYNYNWGFRVVRKK